MPSKAPHPCAYPGCPALTTERYCPDHKTLASRSYDKHQRSPNHNKIYGYRWRQIRDRYIAKHPLCEACLKTGHLVPADEVHHIVTVERGGTHSEENLMSLCQSCHTKTRKA